jgi:hypothetical protein
MRNIGMVSRAGARAVSSQFDRGLAAAPSRDFSRELAAKKILWDNEKKWPKGRREGLPRASKGESSESTGD